MNSDEDDIYPSNGHGFNQDEVRMADFEDGEEEGEEVEDEDSDDEVNFITDVKEEPKQDLGSQPKRQPSLVQSVTETRKASSTPTPVTKGGTVLENKAVSEAPSDRPGIDYPARHTSKLDPNGNPVLPATGKPILSTDFDADFPSDSTKPWRKPGSDITDYFNYGFDEFTWASYCLKQQQMPKEIKEINQVAEQMKAFVEGIPGGSMPGMPGVPTGPSGGTGGGMPQMPGMPGEAEMQQMFQTMMAQGIDPTSMDSNQFMQMMMGGVGGAAMMGQAGPPTGPQASFSGGGGFDQGAGFGGRGKGRGGRRNW